MANLIQTAYTYSFYLIQIEDRMFVDYQLLKDVTVPLRDVVDYEAHISNDSHPMYQKLVYAQTQLNTSLEELQNMV